jgi:hypothetical protein
MSDHGEEANAMMEVLQNTPVSTGVPFPDVCREDPVLDRPPDGSWRHRYWNRLLQEAEAENLGEFEIRTFKAFDAAMYKASFHFQLNQGDMIMLDNHRVSHGRLAFDLQIDQESGKSIPTTRRVINTHILRDV